MREDERRRYRVYRRERKEWWLKEERGRGREEGRGGRERER